MEYKRGIQGKNIKKRAIAFLFVFLLVLSSISISYALSEQNLSYDANGNLIQGFDKYFEYNDFNQLVRVRENNSTGSIIAEYYYDHEGNRVKKIEVGDSENQSIYYISKNFIQIRNSSGVFNETYLYDEYALVAKKDNSGNINYYHPDHLGSTHIVTNDSGDVVEENSYMPFGDIVEGGDSRYSYTGKEKDTDTDLMYYGARYYNPDVDSTVHLLDYED